MCSTSEANPRPRRLLHVLTGPAPALARDLAAAGKRSGSAEVTIIELTAEGVDYDALLDAVFAADTVTVW